MRPRIHILKLILVLTLFACGGNSTEGISTSNGTGFGSLTVQVQWPESSRAAALDSSRGANFPCDGIDEIKVEIYNSESALIASNPGLWTCDQSGGTITGIPAANNCTVVFMAKDDQGIAYYGQDMVNIVPNVPAQAQIQAVSFEPQLQSPSDAASANSVICQWTCADNAQANGIEYELRIWTAENMARPATMATTACQAQPVNLLANTDYYWQVVARDRFGHTRLSPTSRKFSVNLESPLPQAPGNNTTLTPGEVILSWSGSASATYRFVLSTYSDLATPLVDTNISNALSYRIDNLPANQTYYWQVTQLDVAGNPGTPSSLVHFTINEANLVLEKPDNGAILFTDKITLRWYPPQPAPERFAIDLIRVNSPLSELTTETGANNSISPNDLLPGARYDWQVKAKNGAGAVTHISEWRTFYTIDTPKDLLPAHNANLVRGTFACQWASTYPNGRYRFEIADNPTLINASQIACSLNEYQPKDLLPSGIYYWRVVPLDSNLIDANSSYASETRSFSTRLAPPQEVKAVASNRKNALSFDGVEGATQYTIYWSTTPGVTNQSTRTPEITIPSYVHNDLQNSATYYYRVEARNANSVSELSAEVSATPDFSYVVTADGQKIVSLNPQSGARFGLSVAIDGDYAVVSAPNGFFNSSTFSSGAVYFYHRIGPNQWGQTATIVSETIENFGWSVGISGDFAIVGAPGVFVQDKACIFQRDRNASNPNQWYQLSILSPPIQPYINSEFGSAVAIDGDYAVVGDYLPSDGYVTSDGTAFFYHRLTIDPTTYMSWGWVTVQGYPDSDYSSNNNFGFAVAIEGDYAIVSAPKETSGGLPEAGVVRILRRTGTSPAGWAVDRTITDPSPSANGHFGSSVDIDAGLAIIGKPIASGGVAYIFERNAQDDWVSAWTPLAVSNTSQFGIDVAISGDLALVGASHEAVDGRTEAGAAYLFERPEPGANAWDLLTRLTTTAPAQNYDHFGISVDISGDCAIVGAEEYSASGTTRYGSAYIFK